MYTLVIVPLKLTYNDIQYFRYHCVLDWGMARDWNLPIDQEVQIGFWGHQCDGDEPSLSYCCAANRRWVGEKYKTIHGSGYNRFTHDQDIALQCGFVYPGEAEVCPHRSHHCRDGKSTVLPLAPTAAICCSGFYAVVNFFSQVFS